MNKIDENHLLTPSHADKLDHGLPGDLSGIFLVRLAAACAINNKNRH